MKKLILTLILLTIILFNIGCSLKFGKAKDFIKQFDSDNYDESYQIYKKAIQDQDENVANDIERYLLESASKSLKTYQKSNEIVVTEVDEMFNELNRPRWNDLDEVEKIVSEYLILSDSRNYFKQGKKAYDSKNYADAAYNFENVIEDDLYFDDAQKLLQESVVTLRNEILEKTFVFNDSMDYIKAINLFDRYIYYFVNDAEYMASFKTSILAQAEEFRNANDFTSANDLLSKYAYYFSTDSKYSIQLAKVENEQKYNPDPQINTSNTHPKDDVIGYEPEKIVDTDGKQIWRIYIYGGSFHFKGTFKGTGNFIVKLQDDNQDLVELIANEVGDYVSDKRITVPYDGLYYLQVEFSNGQTTYSWY